MLFQVQQCFVPDGYLPSIRTALDNWSKIWQVYSATFQAMKHHDPLMGAAITPGNMWQRIGFSRFASDYWLLAKIIMAKIATAAQGQQIRNETGYLGLARKSTVCGPAGPTQVLEKYDQTSMQQVSDLIADFQQVII